MTSKLMTFDEARSQLRECKAVIFDNDGTLVDSMPVHFAAWRIALSNHGIEFKEERFYQLAGVPAAEIIRTLAQEQGLDHVSVPSVLESRQENLENTLKDVGKVEVVVKLLEDVVSAGIPVGLASGGERGDVLASLEYAGIDVSVFSSVVTREDVYNGKPDPETYHVVAERLGVKPADCIGLEDGDQGLLALENAGMRKMDVRLIEGYPLYSSKQSPMSN